VTNQELLASFVGAYPAQPATAFWRAIEIGVLARRGLPVGLGLDLGCGDGILTDILLRFLRGLAGGAPTPGLVESRRRFFRHLKAGDAEKATQEIESHLTKLHKLLTQSYARSQEGAGERRRPRRARE